MRIGIISDTHDHRRNILQAVEIFRGHEVQYVLHAGDIVAPFATKPFAEVGTAKFIAVFGNNDGEKLQLRRAVESFGGEIHEYCYKGELAGRKVYMTHTNHNVEEVAAATEEEAASMQELTSLAQNLANLAGNLKDLVRRFKV